MDTHGSDNTNMKCVPYIIRFNIIVLYMILNKLRLNDKVDDVLVTVWGSELYSRWKKRVMIQI